MIIILNAKQTKEISALLINKVSNQSYKNELRQSNDYANYFPMARINQNTITSTKNKEICRFMNEPSKDLDPLSCLNVGILQTIMTKLH